VEVLRSSRRRALWRAYMVRFRQSPTGNVVSNRECV
jgi:hypothetical protein